MIIYLGTLIIFRVDFNNFIVNESDKNNRQCENLIDLKSETLFRIFPFSVLIDPSMKIIHLGKSIENLFSSDTILQQQYVYEIFRLIRRDIINE